MTHNAARLVMIKDITDLYVNYLIRINSPQQILVVPLSESQLHDMLLFGLPAPVNNQQTKAYIDLNGLMHTAVLKYMYQSHRFYVDPFHV